SSAGIDLSKPMLVASWNQGRLSPRDLAALFPQTFIPQASFDTCVAVDLSAVDWKAALDSFRAFCTQLTVWIAGSAANAKAVRAALSYATTSLVEFSSGGLADVGALVSAICLVPGIPRQC